MTGVRGLRRPASYMASGGWPHGRVEGPRIVRYAQGFALRLEEAIGDRPLRDVARSAELSHSTLLAILRGDRWPDMVTIAKLEEALRSDLWPGPEIRKRQRHAR